MPQRERWKCFKHLLGNTKHPVHLYGEHIKKSQNVDDLTLIITSEREGVETNSHKCVTISKKQKWW